MLSLGKVSCCPGRCSLMPIPRIFEAELRELSDLEVTLPSRKEIFWDQHQIVVREESHKSYEQRVLLTSGSLTSHIWGAFENVFQRETPWIAVSSLWQKSFCLIEFFVRIRTSKYNHQKSLCFLRPWPQWPVYGWLKWKELESSHSHSF